MAKKPSKPAADARLDVDALLAEADQFLEGNAEVVNPATVPHVEQQNKSDAKTNDSAPGKDTETTATPDPKLELELVNDGMQAVIRKIYPSTTKQEIFVLLQHHQVTFGIQQTRISTSRKLCLGVDKSSCS